VLQQHWPGHQQAQYQKGRDGHEGIVEVAGDGDEVGHQVDGAGQVGCQAQQHQLGEEAGATVTDQCP